MSFFIVIILSSLFFAVVSVVRRRFPGLKVVGMLSPRRKSVSTPIQILCAHLTASRSLLLLKKILFISPEDYLPPPAAWISLVPVGH